MLTFADIRISFGSFRENYGYGVAVVFLVTILVTQIALYAWAQANERQTLPPGPRGWPILGNILAAGSFEGLPHRTLRKLSLKYGGLMYLRLGSVSFVVVSSAEAAKAMFRNNDECFLSRPKLLTFEIFSFNYRTMIFSHGKYWRHLRRLCSTELLSSKRLASYRPGREVEQRNMMKGLSEIIKSGQPVILRKWLQSLSANIMTQMLVNKRFFGEGADVDEALQVDFVQFMSKWKNIYMADIVSNYFPRLRFFAETVQGWRSKIEDYREKSLVLAEKLLEVENHQQRAAEKTSNNEKPYVPDFVDVITAAPLDEGKNLQDKHVLTMIVLELFAAGSSTSSNTVEWAMAELMCHPHYMKRAQEEMDTIVGTDRIVQEADIANLPFFQAVVKETFRLHPSAPVALPRESTAGAEVMGYHIPAKTRVTVNIFAIHRDPEVYENPDEFNPNRFLDRHVDANPLFAFDSFELVPFGVGRRMCPGYNLGNAMTSVMLANLIHSYNWSLPEGVTAIDTDEEPMGGSFSVLLKHPLRLVPKLRHENLAS